MGDGLSGSSRGSAVPERWELGAAGITCQPWLLLWDAADGLILPRGRGVWVP